MLARRSLLGCEPQCMQSVFPSHPMMSLFPRVQKYIWQRHMRGVNGSTSSNPLTSTDKSTYVSYKLLPKPSMTCASETHSTLDLQVRARALHFLPGDRHLLVSYLNHGIVWGIPSTPCTTTDAYPWLWYSRCWDLKTDTELWRVTPDPFRYMYVYPLHSDPELTTTT